MISTLTVTGYNVLFGDAVLIAIPERSGRREVVRHIMIDFGNALSGKSGRDDVFLTVADDVMKRLDGRPIDLYIMTHEHLDHVQGLKFLDSQGIRIPIDQAWLTASARPNYYTHYPGAKRKLELYRAEYDRLHIAATRLGLTGMAEVAAFLAINNYRSTRECVDHIRKVAMKKPAYVHRTFPLHRGKHHSFTETIFDIWAPELKTTAYYGRFQPLMLQGVGAGSSRVQKLTPPPGVDPEGFCNLLEHLQSGLGDNMLAIDRAQNNTSIVLCIEWRGWRLLFPGDAERRSWMTLDKQMTKAKHRQIQPVHFLKVSHHGSHTGTPADEILDKILPPEPHDERKRCALVSTWPDTYKGVPDGTTIDSIRDRVDVLYDTREVKPGEGLTIEFEG